MDAGGLIDVAAAGGEWAGHGGDDLGVALKGGDVGCVVEERQADVGAAAGVEDEDAGRGAGEGGDVKRSGGGAIGRQRTSRRVVCSRK